MTIKIKDCEIKQLNWVKYDEGESASTEIGDYVWGYSNRFYPTPGKIYLELFQKNQVVNLKMFETIAEAKTAAQTDFETRVLSCLQGGPYKADAAEVGDWHYCPYVPTLKV